MLDDGVLGIDFAEAVKASTLFSLHNQGTIVEHLEEIECLWIWGAMRFFLWD